MDNYPIDEELRIALNELLARFPGGFNAPNDIFSRRFLMNSFLKEFPKSREVHREDRFVNSSLSSHHIPIRIYRPKHGKKSDGLIFTIHGGGMVMGSIESDDANAVRLCLQFEVTVIAIEYRLAPEHPFPAAIDDCFDVALWIFSNSSKEGWDLTKSIAFGGSAGGGLAIATGMNLRDHAANNFATIVAPYPMVDHKNSLPSTHRITDLGVWDRKANEESWAWYLGASNSFLNREQIHPYAAPLHAENLAGLPPVFIDVGDCDLFLDENINLVGRLIEEGVSVEFHCYPGAFHASELLSPEATLSQRIWNTRFDYMRRWLT